MTVWRFPEDSLSSLLPLLPPLPPPPLKISGVKSFYLRKRRKIRRQPESCLSAYRRNVLESWLDFPGKWLVEAENVSILS